ncbi:pilus assembly protein [Paraburkholderia sp. NMBU_R16]|uniref:TadE/TadG family type IV pilus assembly protein n=1 Tax=Paraburkholderia sp. NMBU_R16 TaxID=2698676 RepID=UPI00156728C6|nr:TadE/TadG family type IV pilus assembly protein [Paraburkholderia sp. NMBU_R16]NRO96861.1 pilus assembly protein [Paraburkholderia sp. NMBU_R16]
MKPRRHLGRHRRTRAGGIVSLEFVLMLPFLLMLMLGIIDMSLLLCDKAIITNAAGAAARQGVVLRSTPYTTTQIQNVALTFMQGSLVSGGTATTPTVTPSGSCLTIGSGNALQVTIKYTYNGLMVGSAFSALTGPLTLTATAVMNCE